MPLCAVVLTVQLFVSEMCVMSAIGDPPIFERLMVTVAIPLPPVSITVLFKRETVVPGGRGLLLLLSIMDGLADAFDRRGLVASVIVN